MSSPLDSTRLVNKRYFVATRYVSGDYFKENKVVRKELNFVIEFYKIELRFEAL